MEDRQIYTTSKVAELERQTKKFLGRLSDLKNKFVKSARKNIRVKKEELQKKSEEKKRVPPQNVKIEESKLNEQVYLEKTKVYENEGLKLPPEKIQFIISITLFLLILFIMAIGIYLPYSSR